MARVTPGSPALIQRLLALVDAVHAEFADAARGVAADALAGGLAGGIDARLDAYACPRHGPASVSPELVTALLQLADQTARATWLLTGGGAAGADPHGGPE